MKLRWVSIFILIQIVTCQQISLIFVTDATSSMKNNIDQIREVCSEVLDKFHTEEKKLIANYVLSIFHDPDLEPIINTTEIQEIKNVLSTTKITGGGDDCSKNSIAGIKASLPYALPNSIMFVFTDAAAKDYDLENEVLDILRLKQITVIFVIPPTTSSKCLKNDRLTGPGYEVYEKIAREANGFILEMDKSETKDVISILTNQMTHLIQNYDYDFNLAQRKTKRESEYLPTKQFVDMNPKSLVFVTDITKTMKGEVDQLRQVLDKFQGEGVFTNYVLSMFRDPKIESVITTRDPQELKKILSTTRISGGKLCPKNTMAGIRASLQYTLPKSMMFVLTDGTAKDHQLGEDILKALRRKQISVSFFITPSPASCRKKDPLNGPGYEIYQKIAKETNGMVFNIDEVDIKKVFDALKYQFSENFVNLENKNYPESADIKEEVSIGDEMEKLIITFTGNYDGELSATGPGNKKYESETIGNIQQISVMSPTPGKWLINAESTASSTLQIAGISKAGKYDYGFSSTSVYRVEDTHLQPTKNSKNILNIFVGNPDAIKKLTHAIFTLDDGTENKFDLKKITENLYTSTIDVPENQFKISVNVVDESNRETKVIASNSVAAVEPEFLKAKPKSLIFVTDVTDSMKAEVEMLQEVTEKLLDNVHGAGSFVFANYVLSMFRDPDLEPITNTTDTQELKKALSTVKFADGGDCPENSMAGIKATLEYALPNSIMFVFTDATAKDHQLGEEVLKMLRDKQISVSFLITPAEKCRTKDRHKGPGYEIYEKIAKETDGMILKLEEEAITEVFEKLMHQFDPNYEVLKKKYYPSTENTEMNIVVTKLSKLIVTSTGDGGLSATDPNHADHSPENTENINQLVIENPIPGDWVFNLDSTDPFTVTVAGISDVKFDYGFSIEPVKSKEDSYNQPLKGTQNYLSVFVSNPKAVETLKHVYFIFGDGEKNKIELKKVTENVYQSKLIDIPQKPFKISVEGDDESKIKIERMLSKVVEGVEIWPKPTPEPKIILEPEINPGPRTTTSRMQMPSNELNKEGKLELMELLDEMNLPPKLINIFIKNDITVDMIKNSLNDEKFEDITNQYCKAAHCETVSEIGKYREDNDLYDTAESKQCSKKSISAAKRATLTETERKELEEFTEKMKFPENLLQKLIDNKLSVDYIKNSLSNDELHKLLNDYEVSVYDKIRESIKKFQKN